MYEEPLSVAISAQPTTSSSFDTLSVSLATDRNNVVSSSDERPSDSQVLVTTADVFNITRAVALRRYTNAISFYLILDSGASVSLVNDRSLLHDMVYMPRIHISGVGGSELYADEEGQLGPFGPALFVPEIGRNILSLSVLSMLHPVVFYSTPQPSEPDQVQGYYQVRVHGHLAMFTPDAERLYSFDCPRSWTLPRSRPLTDATSLRYSDLLPRRLARVYHLTVSSPCSAPVTHMLLDPALLTQVEPSLPALELVGSSLVPRNPLSTLSILGDSTSHDNSTQLVTVNLLPYRTADIAETSTNDYNLRRIATYAGQCLFVCRTLPLLPTLVSLVSRSRSSLSSTELSQGFNRPLSPASWRLCRRMLQLDPMVTVHAIEDCDSPASTY